MTKRLVFEGCGTASPEFGEIGNCRIRTACHTDEGEGLYFEVSCVRIKEFAKCSCFRLASDRPEWLRNALHNALLNGVELTIGFSTIHPLPYPHPGFYNGPYYHDPDLRAIPWSIDGLKKALGMFGATYDEFVFDHHLHFYSVFDMKGEKYRYGDEYDWSDRMNDEAMGVRKIIQGIELAEGKRHPNFSLWASQTPGERNVLFLLRHFEGRNRMWCIHLGGDPAEDVRSMSEIPVELERGQ